MNTQTNQPTTREILRETIGGTLWFSGLICLVYLIGAFIEGIK